MRESAVTSHIRLEAAHRGIELWRNNSGGFYDESGRFIRFGLGSFLPQHECKSSDYIGITPILVTPEMVGKVLGVFTAIEIKESGWVFNKNDKRALAQKKFIDIVKKAGGIAGFAASKEDFIRIIRNEY